MTVQLWFGEKKIEALGDLLKQISAKRVLLVTGKGSFSLSGAEEAVAPALTPMGVTRFSDFRTNPQFEEIELGLRLARETLPDAILAIGGGSALDVGKIIALGTRSDLRAKDLQALEKGGLANTLPIIAIPTTAGTGSEVTHFAVAYDGYEKHSVAHSTMLPTHVIVDPELTYSMSPAITASTGLDAFCQAVEALWSVGSTAESREYATKAIQLAWNHLPVAVNTPNPEARRAMCEAAMLAGKAINIAKTTACHAISYAITSHWGVPHGHAVALTLGPMIAFNADCSDGDVCDPRGAAHVQEVLATVKEVIGCGSDASPIEAMDTFIRSLGLQTRLPALGITTPEERELIASSVNQQRLANNPRTLDKKSLTEILLEVS